MPWTWRYQDANGKSVDGPSSAFGSQSDAESWIGQEWRALAESGVVAVELLEDERVEYQMSLLPPD
ncbi:MAG: hypothetical protein ACRDT1_10915 [Micromonosporaceae bacterium]